MATVNNPYTWGTGRRKTAVARVRIREGSGQYLVNGLPVDEYFHTETERADARAPIHVADLGGRLDVFVNVVGSGKSAQSGAVMLGLGRALSAYRTDLEPQLRDHGFLTRDARMVERKKYGHKKARKSFQFSKR
jgi:small subunit ribosomal protein S9